MKSLTNIFWITMTLLYLIFAVTIIYLWTYHEIVRAHVQINNVRQEYINSREKAAKAEVNQIIEYIHHKKSLAEMRVRNEVFSKTGEAWKTARYIYEKNRKTKKLSEIKKMVHDALYSDSWDNGKGYYFAEDMSGIEMINRNEPELQGKNVLKFQDCKGTYIMKAFISIATSPAEEGFASYYYKKPGCGIEEPKISYIKYFKPFNWVIGNGKYIVDEENKIKNEVIRRIDHIKYGDKGFVFAGTWDAKLLAGPFKGDDPVKLIKYGWKKTVKKIVNKARAEGGFLSYMAPGFNENNSPEPVISYVAPFKPWHWYVGSCFYTDKIKALITARQKALQKNIKFMILKCVFILSIFLCVSCMLVYFWAGRIKKNLSVFSEFFRLSAGSNTAIKEDQVFFTEFKSLANSANRMSRERRRFEKILSEKEKKYRTLFESSFDAFSIIDADTGRYVDCNKAAVRLYGIGSKDNFIGKTIGMFSPEFQRDGQWSKGNAMKYMDMAVAKGSIEFEWTNIREDGTVFPSFITLSAMHTGDKNLVLEVCRDLTELKDAESRREQLICKLKDTTAKKERIVIELQQALSKIKVLKGLLPICSSCKKIRDDKGYWKNLESYIENHSDAVFSHGLCPDCLEKLYGDEAWYIKGKKNKRKT